MPEETDADVFARGVKEGWMIEPPLCLTHRPDSDEYLDQVASELRAMGYQPCHAEGYKIDLHRNGERAPVCHVCGAAWHHHRRREALT